jgi:hypothetical protein
MPHAGEHHHHTVLICSGYNFGIAHAATGLNHASGSCVYDNI